MIDGRVRFSVLAVYAATIFLSAFLLFQVQPLLSKYILPWFGGTPAVWTTCMLFFQSALFAGYAYAHGVTRQLSPRGQTLMHIALLAAACLLLPIIPADTWKPTGEENPAVQILLLLAATIGLPFFVLSATGPLLQSWFARTHPGVSPYRLYALSNVGSLLALLTYPFLFDPAIDSPGQAVVWSWGFGLFALLCAGCAWWSGRVPQLRISESDPAELSNDSPDVFEQPQSPVPTWSDRVLWFVLPMTASVMLLAITNQVCLDIASVPFLWVAPLSLYLLTFILCFDAERWYSRRVFAAGIAISFAGILVAIHSGASAALHWQLLAYFAGLFCCAMFCHGELVRLKPPPESLTAFYLVISAGGAAGGLLVGLVAPFVFPVYLELPLGMLAAYGLVLLIYYRDPLSPLARGRVWWAWAVFAGIAVGLTVGLAEEVRDSFDETIAVSRNFYGVLRVKEYRGDNSEEDHRYLMHGHIMHGMQFLDADKRRLPTTYYGRDSAVGLVLTNVRPEKPKHVGIVGLGVGTLATYAKPGDRFRIYEINTDVERLARKHFSYLEDSRGKVTVVIGDARLELEREPPQQFDVLVLDAFSGDAIPMHLLTLEAFRIYRRHLKPDGVLLVHISNLFFELSPVVAAAANELGWKNTQVGGYGDDELGTSGNDWMVVTKTLDRAGFEDIRERGVPADGEPLLWTDQKNNLIDVLR